MIDLRVIFVFCFQVEECFAGDGHYRAVSDSGTFRRFVSLSGPQVCRSHFPFSMMAIMIVNLQNAPGASSNMEKRFSVSTEERCITSICTAELSVRKYLSSLQSVFCKYSMVLPATVITI